jgi:uncharacterized protein YijF (DUF1287 family)
VAAVRARRSRSTLRFRRQSLSFALGETSNMKSLIALLAVLSFVAPARGGQESELGFRVVSGARQQIGVTKEYDPGYTALKYPGGDVPLHTGVCSDVVVRSLRQVGVDLQKEVHEDMQKNFSAYPQRWGLKVPDKNIDHRRVPNLMRYFERHHIAMYEKLKMPESYRPGDIVAWDVGRGVLHIGIVSDTILGRTHLIIHNIGSGAKEEDILLKFQVIGHYRLKEGTQNGAANGSQPIRSGTNTTSSAAGSRR